MADYYVRSGAGGAATGADWTNAFTTLSAALSGCTNADRLFVADDHSESTAAAVSLGCPNSAGLQILCVNTHTTTPPTGLANTAVVAVGAASAELAITGFAYIYGIIFNGGTNAATACRISLNYTSNPCGLILENCDINLRANAAAKIYIGGIPASASNDDAYVELIDCTIKFSHSGQNINIGPVRFHATGLSLDSSGSTPTTLFTPVSDGHCIATIEASDLSGEAFTNLVAVNLASPAQFLFRNCKLPASIAVTTGAIPSVGGPIVVMHNCDSADTNYRIAEVSFAGSVVSDTSVYNDAGADDGSGQGFSWKMATSASAAFPQVVLYSPEIVKWNSTLSSVTATVEIVHDGATAFDDDEIWLEVQYLGTSGYPQGSFVKDCKATVLDTAAAQATSTASWTGDTGTGPNGSSTWNTLKLEVTFTPAEIGYIHARVAMAVASKTAYIDPLLTVA